MILLGMIGYVLAQFAVGVWVSRRVNSESDYILAGRRLGPVLVAFSVFATWFGAEAIVATSAEVFDKGISGALVDPLAYGLAVIAAGFLYAAMLWRQGVTTFADVFRARFSPFVEKLVVVVLLPGSVFWAAAQIRAFGQVLSSTSHLSLSDAIMLAAVLVASYSVIGGLLADAVTDFFQGAAVIIGLVVLTIVVSVAAGGIGAAVDGAPAEHLAFSTQVHGTPLEAFEAVAVAFFGSFVAIELISRFLGARSAAVARGGTMTGGIMYIAIGILPIFLGLAAAGLVQSDPALKAKLVDSEQVVAVLSEHYLPRWHYVVFGGALISAILSVVHSALHASGAQVSHNIVVHVIPGLGTRGKLRAARLSVVALTGAAFLLALTSDRIKELVEIASAFGSAGVFISAAFGLFTRFGGPISATASILLGTAVWAVGRFGLEWEAPYIVALAGSGAAYVIIGLFERQRSAAAVTSAAG
ncbi:Sodium:solute symporter [Hyphomicrobium sp. 1Nfss2.1]|uniref:sodium:solute symporter family transporter n=1 Tax=Hyphomicrobium sp. 1Nfss2.1 TaxID=3413936 RepID=UPI003C79E09C